MPENADQNNSEYGHFYAENVFSKVRRYEFSLGIWIMLASI